jgi:hypothetical protein
MLRNVEGLGFRAPHRALVTTSHAWAPFPSITIFILFNQKIRI